MAGYAIPAQIGSAAFFFVVGVSWTGRLSWRHGSSSNGLPQFDRSMSQRGRGHFSKDRTVNRSEPSKVRELLMLSSLRDTCCRRISTSQRGEEHAIAPRVHLHPACSSRLADVPSRSRRDGGFGQASTNEFLDVELLEHEIGNVGHSVG